jgi:hypothetical protein
MPTRVATARNRFEARIAQAEEFARRCRAARHASANRGALIASQVEWTYETSVIKVVVASERFFEWTLGLYVLGDRSSGGYRPRRRREVRSSLPAVLEVFRGDQNFVGWNSPSVVITRAERWLRDGEPYRSTLSSASQVLAYLRQMRNAIAHESDSAVGKYEDATRRLYGALPRRVAPGAQLLQPPPPGIPYLAGVNLFEAAMVVYRAVARGVAP